MNGYTEACLKAAKKNHEADNLLIFTGYKELINNKIRSFDLHLFIKNVLLFPFLFSEQICSVFLKKLILSFGSPVPCPTVMYHKSMIGPFEFFKDFQCNMDWDAWLRLSERKGSFIYIKDKLVVHRLYKYSQTSVQIKKNIRQREDKIIFEKLWPHVFVGFFARIYSLAMKFNEEK